MPYSTNRPRLLRWVPGALPHPRALTELIAPRGWGVAAEGSPWTLSILGMELPSERAWQVGSTYTVAGPVLAHVQGISEGPTKLQSSYCGASELTDKTKGKLHFLLPFVGSPYIPRAFFSPSRYEKLLAFQG